MKNKSSKISFAIIAIVLTTAGGFFTKIYAEENTQPTAEQLSKIQSECSNLKTTLKEVHSKDALTRVNLGKDYEYLLDNLMAKLNTRIVVNKLDGANLITQAANFSSTFTSFKNNYQAYERELIKLLAQDCTKNPLTFFESLQKVRELRAEVSNNTYRLNEIAKKYQADLIEFKGEI